MLIRLIRKTVIQEVELKITTDNALQCKDAVKTYCIPSNDGILSLLVGSGSRPHPEAHTGGSKYEYSRSIKRLWHQ